MKKTFFTAAFALLMGLLLSLAPLAAQAQCTMCKSQVEAARQERDDYDVAGLNKGIVYMMTVPYILMVRWATSGTVARTPRRWSTLSGGAFRGAGAAGIALPALPYRQAVHSFGP